MITQTNILSEHPLTAFQEFSANTIFIADFTRRTQHSANPRSVEISEVPPTMDDGSSVDAVTFHNDQELPIEVATFDDYRFEDSTGTNVEHCEGSLYTLDNPQWIAFFEIKDCEERNILNHKEKAVRQVTNVANDFRTRGIIGSEKVYGIISFPRKHTAFNDDIFGDIIEYTHLRRTTGILFYATNEVFILNHNELRPVLS